MYAFKINQRLMGLEQHKGKIMTDLFCGWIVPLNYSDQ